ncbi:hypothetical protein ACQCWA_00330 [Rossellomorea aquimaris]
MIEKEMKDMILAFTFLGLVIVIGILLRVFNVPMLGLPTFFSSLF